MTVSCFAFLVAALAGATGMSLGIYMGMAHDFALAPAHAHLNLLGWVTMMLYGLYHRGVERSGNRLAWTQVGAGALGFPLMSGGLGVYLATGDDRLVLVVIAGSVLCLGSMLLFLAVLRSDTRRRMAAMGRPALA